jgi:predicted AAA+ superfamily ATPase
MERHWFRGGYPDSFLAADNAASRHWCEDFIISYVERYLFQLGITAAPLILRRLCSMAAHQQGDTLNLSPMAGSLEIDGKTVRHYLDLLEGLYLVRSIPAWSGNTGKRLVKSPKVYWRDSGLLHSRPTEIPTLCRNPSPPQVYRNSSANFRISAAPQDDWIISACHPSPQELILSALIRPQAHRCSA